MIYFSISPYTSLIQRKLLKMKWKLFLILMVLGSIGIYCMSYIALPMILAHTDLPLPLEQIQIANLIQMCVFLGLCTLAGVVLHEKVYLNTPIIKVMILQQKQHISVRPMIQWTMIGGILGGIILLAYQVVFQHLLSVSLINKPPILPIGVRLFYGGITEEILIRWGVMTLLVWILVKVFTKNFNAIPAHIYWIAIFVSALMFAFLHLPILFSMLATPSITLIFMVIIGNSLFGLIAGYLYWKHGLESAMIAHILAHLIAFLIIS